MPGAYNPQTLNRYSYCYNNPLIYVDPTGHISWESAPGAKEGVNGGYGNKNSSSGGSGNSSKNRRRHPMEGKLYSIGSGYIDYWGNEYNDFGRLEKLNITHGIDWVSLIGPQAVLNDYYLGLYDVEQIDYENFPMGCKLYMGKRVVRGEFMYGPDVVRKTVPFDPYSWNGALATFGFAMLNELVNQGWSNGKIGGYEPLLVGAVQVFQARHPDLFIQQTQITFEPIIYDANNKAKFLIDILPELKLD